MEADLRRVYGVRLRDLFTGGMTWRELGAYVRAMPPDSATRTALNNGRPEPSGQEILLADCFDMLQHVDWHVQATAVSKKSELPKKPKPYPRWWETNRRKGRKHSSQRVARIEDARKRAADRRRDIAQGKIA